MTEPTNEQKSRFIVEQTGGCWHEWVEYHDEDRLENYECINCHHLFLVIHPLMPLDNPAFTDDVGIVRLLRLMNDREDGGKFLERLWKTQGMNPNWLVFYMLNEGELLDVAYQWLKEKEGK